MTEFDKQNQSPYKLRIGEEIKIKKIKKKKKGPAHSTYLPILDGHYSSSRVYVKGCVLQQSSQR